MKSVLLLDENLVYTLVNQIDGRFCVLHTIHSFI